MSPDILFSPLIITPCETKILSVSDGSTDPFRRSGTAIVQRITDGVGPDVTRRFVCPLRNTGDNYVAEAAGVALQLHLAPSQADLCMITDNKGLFLVIDGWLQGLKQPEGWEVAERKRIRQGARCFMEASKARLRARTGRTSIRFVPSHTNGKSVGKAPGRG